MQPLIATELNELAKTQLVVCQPSSRARGIIIQPQCLATISWLLEQPMIFQNMPFDMHELVHLIYIMALIQYWYADTI